MEINVGILAIGNEVVEGQITNRNASWLSQQLEQLGCTSLFHLSCRDHDEDIQKSLHFLKTSCQLILVCGGLGPTKDDFTRQCLSRFCNQPLELNDDQWTEIEKKLLSRGVTIRDGHKNQALFPKGSQVLDNQPGIAPGFCIKTSGVFLASLPGPPRELQWIYKNQLEPLIVKALEPKKDSKLYTWICLGTPESEVAHITESIIGTQFEYGFRLHKPYVEVKVWAPANLDVAQTQLFKKLSDKLSPWLVADKIANIRSKVASTLDRFSKVFVIDQVSTGLFLDILKEGPFPAHLRYQCFENDSFRAFSKDEVRAIIKTMNAKEGQLVVGAFPSSETSAYYCIGHSIEEIKLPRNIPLKSVLGQRYILETGFLRLMDLD